jgi:hypothetical protein
LISSYSSLSSFYPLVPFLFHFLLFDPLFLLFSLFFFFFLFNVLTSTTVHSGHRSCIEI